MSIGLSSACFYPEINTEFSIKKMKALDFNYGEIFLNTPSEYEEKFAEKLREEAEAADFRIISVHAFSSSFEPFLFDRYERRRKDLMKNFSSVCKAASIVGAKYYTFHGIRGIDSNGVDLKFICDIYNELTYRASECGILLSQENVSWCMSCSLDFLKHIKEQCRYPLCFTLDIKQAYKAGIKPVEYIQAMGKDLKNIHINDRDDKNVCLLPGNGKVDYAEILMELEQIKYNGDFIMEVYRDNFKKETELTEAKNMLREKYNL